MVRFLSMELDDRLFASGACGVVLHGSRRPAMLTNDDDDDGFAHRVPMNANFPLPLAYLRL